MKKIFWIVGAIVCAIFVLRMMGAIMTFAFQLGMIIIFASGIYFWGQWWWNKRKNK